jgi:hypothetical protein
MATVEIVFPPNRLISIEFVAVLQLLRDTPVIEPVLTA